MDKDQELLRYLLKAEMAHELDFVNFNNLLYLIGNVEEGKITEKEWKDLVDKVSSFKKP